MSAEDCGSTLGIRYPSAPSDEWDTARCIQEHDGAPGADGTIHDSGDGWKWMLLDGFREVAPLVVPASDLKMLRETLCIAQTAFGATGHVQRLQQLIDEIDRHRPLGADGTHGDLHTATCGCEDRP